MATSCQSSNRIIIRVVLHNLSRLCIRVNYLPVQGAYLVYLRARKSRVAYSLCRRPCAKFTFVQPTQFVITCYKKWMLVNVNMLQYIKQKAISWDVYNIFRRSLCIWSINLMSFKDLQQSVFPFPHLTQKVRTPFQISDTSNTLFCTNINTKTTTATIILFPLKSRMKEKIVKRVSVYRITTTEISQPWWVPELSNNHKTCLPFEDSRSCCYPDNKLSNRPQCANNATIGRCISRVLSACLEVVLIQLDLSSAFITIGEDYLLETLEQSFRPVPILLDNSVKVKNSYTLFL